MILFLTKYSRSGASSRYRSYQYGNVLAEAGFSPSYLHLFSDAYLARRYRLGRGSLCDIAGAFLRRLKGVVAARRCDLAVIEYELLPYFPALLERLLCAFEVPFIVDYDDAVFHNYDSHSNAGVRRLLGSKIDTVMRLANCVVAGNDYLAAHARAAGARRVEIIPTVVDLSRYPVSPRVGRHAIFTIGWIGSPSTAGYLRQVSLPLAVMAGEGAAVRLVGSGPVVLPSVAPEVRSWSEANEVDDILGFDAGIMPLPDTPWTRGKCGLKLIQYMACRRPVVASPVGVNREIVEHGVNGYLAERPTEWERAFRTLLSDPDLRVRMGRAGRRKVEQHFSLQVMGPRFAALVESVIKVS